ncbi:hypothetical protein CEXT_793281 [Caerostris extrusa]|uniref:Uncharacterized protein n=1 Tax=Caerostris extrusa TaxID=172846 RepID=A0AAV4SUL7_CAEEX|nr:hypothetical protein CEXT_793281 [Caerostris extrusa]
MCPRPDDSSVLLFPRPKLAHVRHLSLSESLAFPFLPPPPPIFPFFLPGCQEEAVSRLPLAVQMISFNETQATKHVQILKTQTR